MVKEKRLRFFILPPLYQTSLVKNCQRELKYMAHVLQTASLHFKIDQYLLILTKLKFYLFMHLLPLIKPKAKATQINEINLVSLTLKRETNGSTSNYSTTISSIKKVMHKWPPEQR